MVALVNAIQGSNTTFKTGKSGEFQNIFPDWGKVWDLKTKIKNPEKVGKMMAKKLIKLQDK